MWLFIVGVSVLIISCDDEDFKSLNGRWKLAHFYNVESGTVDQSIFLNKQSIILTFSDDGRAGTISRDSEDAVNSINGMYELGQHNRITFTPIDILAKEAWNKDVLMRFATADFVKISDNTLNITCNKGKDVFLFVREN
jgi:hypothetical protein